MKVYGGRDMLNLPGYQSTASIVAEVRTEERWKYAQLDISDCDRKISLEFNLNDALQYENDLHKIDVLVKRLQEFRRHLKRLHDKPMED